MSREVWRSPNEWVLMELESGALVLSVNCGTSVGFQTNHELSPNERWIYLDILASKIVNHPWAFATEGIEVPPIDFTSRGTAEVLIPPGR